VDRAATNVVESRSARWGEYRQQPPLLRLVDETVLDRGIGQERGHLLGVRGGEEDALVTDQRLTGALAPPVPAPPGTARELDEVGTVVDMAEDSRVPGRLTAPGLGPLEATDVHARARKCVGRSKAHDSRAHNGDISSALHPQR
jgi:hypothetical protein